MSAETEALKQFYAAVNGNDIQAAIKDFDPEIVRKEFEGFPMEGTYRGLAEVKGNLAKGRGTWAEGACETEQFFQSGDKVVVYVHAWVRLKDSTEWTGERFADGFAFRDARITEFHSFVERAHALEWAGIKER